VDQFISAEPGQFSSAATLVKEVLEAGTTAQPSNKEGGRQRKAWCKYDAKSKLWSLVNND
jgi:hypothetical protein